MTGFDLTEHDIETDDRPCGPCGDRRRANQVRPVLSLVESPTQKCLIHMEPDVDHCRGCAADRKAAESA